MPFPPSRWRALSRRVARNRRLSQRNERTVRLAPVVTSTNSTSSKQSIRGYVTVTLYLRSIEAVEITQMRLLANALRSQACDVLTTREPGGTPVGLKLRAALLDAHDEVDPLTELLVFAADRAQHVRRVLRPALASGQIVISDRYADATVAYQGAGRGFSPTLISQIIDLATESKPAMTLVFDRSLALRDEPDDARKVNTKGKGRSTILKMPTFTRGCAQLPPARLTDSFRIVPATAQLRTPSDGATAIMRFYKSGTPKGTRLRMPQRQRYSLLCCKSRE